jgi:hypothetical protein
VHRRIRLPGRGEKPFFPLCASRSTGPTHPENSARLPAPRLVAFAPSGIIRTRSLHSGSDSLDSCSNDLPAVHFVAHAVYDTVVLERRDIIYDNLRDLRFEYRAGKYSESDYGAMKHSLELETAILLAEIDQATESVTRRPRGPRPAQRGAQ